MLGGLDPLRFLDVVGTERLVIDRILERAEEIRVDRLKNIVTAIGQSVAKALAGK